MKKLFFALTVLFIFCVTVTSCTPNDELNDENETSLIEKDEIEIPTDKP